MNITSQVYDFLWEQTEQMQEAKDQLNNINRDIDSQRYTADYVREKLRPQAEGLNRAIRDQGEDVIKQAGAMIDRYLDDVKASQVLNASELTDDVKLFSCGVTLSADDVVAIMRRNANNHTMLTLAQKYAKQHDLTLGPDAVYDTTLTEATQTARALMEAVRYYGNHIAGQNAQKMLRQFFGVKQRA